jgi:hypothetical protein
MPLRSRMLMNQRARRFVPRKRALLSPYQLS